MPPVLTKTNVVLRINVFDNSQWGLIAISRINSLGKVPKGRCSVMSVCMHRVAELKFSEGIGEGDRYLDDMLPSCFLFFS